MKVTMHFQNKRMRRLVASGLLPERAGQPVKAWVHISLADLMVLEGDSALQEAVDRAGPGAVGRAPRGRVRNRQRAAARGWTATPPGRSPATRPWPPS